jgi:hypothetical protein
MDGRVDKSSEISVSSAVKLNDSVPCPNKHHMVIDVKEADLVVLLAENLRDGTDQNGSIVPRMPNSGAP